MKNKSTKDKLISRLELIQAEEYRIKDNLFYNNFHEKNFWQILKITIDWKWVGLLCLLFELICLLNIKELWFIMLLFPFLIFLLCIATAAETWQKIKFMKKLRSENK